MRLSEKLKNLREEKGDTQDMLAEKTGIAVSSLRYYENGIKNKDGIKEERLPDTYNLKILKDYYNVSYDYLLNDECTNKTIENIDIGNKLNLSDKAIENIIKLSENFEDSGRKTTSDTFNYFIETFDNLYDYISLLYSLKLYIRLYKEVYPFEEITHLSTSILYGIKNNKSDILNNIFSYYDNKIKNINALYDVYGYYECYSDIDTFKIQYNQFKESCFNKKHITIFKDYIQGYNVAWETVTKAILNQINNIKYNISNIFNDYLNNLENIKIVYNGSNYIDNSLSELLKNDKKIKQNSTDKEEKYYL